MLKWCLCPASFIWHCLLLIRVACQSFDQLACSWISLKILEFSGLHYCLFVKDHNLLLCKSCVFRCCFSQRQLWYHIIVVSGCQQLFKSFLTSYNSWRRRRDLNPRAAINGLLPFQGSPFNRLGTSPVSSAWTFTCMKVSGERGIRTLAPFRTNGFQDRLVMTASISLQVVFVYRHQPATCIY